jgi:hypothetical protein
MFSYHKLKQEFISVLGLSLFQIWWNFNFPAVIRLGSFYALMLSVVTTISYAWLFSDAQRFRPMLELETFDDAPNAQLLKDFMRAGWLIIAHIVMLYMWYINYFLMPSIYYVIWYAHCLITFTVLYIAAYR